MTTKRDVPDVPCARALRVRERARAFALSLPEAVEEFPWDEVAVAKVNKKIFVFLGVESAGSAPVVTVKLREPDPHAHALTFPGAGPARYGLGKSGWVSLPLGEKGAPDADLLSDWIAESYRVIAPKRLVVQLDSAPGS